MMDIGTNENVESIILKGFSVCDRNFGCLYTTGMGLPYFSAMAPAALRPAVHATSIDTMGTSVLAMTLPKYRFGTGVLVVGISSYTPEFILSLYSSRVLYI